MSDRPLVFFVKRSLTINGSSSSGHSFKLVFTEALAKAGAGMTSNVFLFSCLLLVIVTGSRLRLIAQETGRVLRVHRYAQPTNRHIIPVFN